jgi:two-component system, OmpR family, copper resistance phosphate regulon response regulator CusR
MSARILLVEDEAKVASIIKKGLEESTFSVMVAFDGQMGLRMALTNNFDLIILDINIPLINGYELCKEIRKINQQIPILMLTAYSSLDDKITGFNSGTDDYIVKPFEFKELLIRINALLKRSNLNIPTGNILTVADLSINLETKIVRRGGEKIELTLKEFLLLVYLVRNKGKVISRSEISEKVWNIKFETGTNVVEVYVNFLRNKIDKGFSSKLIHTKSGMGYILNDEL